jgi:ABC-2 type transport system ATP-binding protein
LTGGSITVHRETVRSRDDIGKAGEPDGNLVIEALGVTKRFGDIDALAGADLEVKAGQIHGLVGPNGAGKTTLLRVLFGLVAADAGSVTVLGQTVTAAGGSTIEGVGGFVEEPRFYPYLSARRNLELLAELDGGETDRVDEVLGQVGLADRAGRKAGTLSSGARQRLGVAAALLRSPKLLLLDEPTVGLDPSGMSEMTSMLRELRAHGVTAVISSHHMAELDSVCDGVTVLREGRSVWQGSMERLRAESPAPANRLSTSDDARTIEIARSHPGVAVVVDPEGWLTVSGSRDSLDEFVLALGQAGIAVRRLELLMSALESMFLALTGVPPERAGADSPGRVGAAP